MQASARNDASLRPRTAASWWSSTAARACGARSRRCSATTRSSGAAHDEPLDLYEIIRTRYQRSSTILTSNRSVEEWPPLFGDPLLASAAMDRLLHGAHVIEMERDTFRNPPPAKRAKTEVRSNGHAR